MNISDKTIKTLISALKKQNKIKRIGPDKVDTGRSKSNPKKTVHFSDYNLTCVASNK